MAEINITRGMSQNNIPFVRLEGGPKIAMIWFGGPGNTIPTGWLFNTFTKPFHPLLEKYTLIMLTRRNGMPEGYTTHDMSNDYAELITAEYGGKVDLVIGTSYGGIVAQHFAVDHSELVEHLVISAAAWEVSELGKRSDYRFAELLHEGKPRQAWQGMAGALTSNPIMVALMKPLLWLMGPSIIGDGYTEIKQIRAAFAQYDHGKKISNGVFVVDSDFTFGMARMIINIFEPIYHKFNIERIE